MGVDILAIDLIAKVLVYSPKERITPIDAMLHPYYNEIRGANNKLDTKKNLEHLFWFSEGIDKFINFIFFLKKILLLVRGHCVFLMEK